MSDASIDQGENSYTFHLGLLLTLAIVTTSNWQWFSPWALLALGGHHHLGTGRDRCSSGGFDK